MVSSTLFLPPSIALFFSGLRGSAVPLRTLPKVSVGMAVTGISANAQPDCGGSGVSAMFWK